MLRKDKRSFALCLVLGDGCLCWLKRKNKLYGALTIDHGIKQADYQAWKAQLLSYLFNRKVKVRSGHKGQSVQISICDKRFRSWRKFIYHNDHKDLSLILPFIRHPEMALACWLMDDGYVEPSKDKRYPKQIYSAALRIFTNDQKLESLNKVIKWFQDIFKVTLKIRYVKDKNYNKAYPFLKLNCNDSLKIWHIIRDFVLQFKSMKYKFRYLEHIYQLRVIQRVPGKYTLPEDIVSAFSNKG
jgi:hypothetical protein